jgi:hypothetical protein
VLITRERIEQILETPYSRVNASLEAWRGLHFRSPFVARLLAAMVEDIENDCAAGALVGVSLTSALVARLAIGPRALTVVESRSAPSSQGFRSPPLEQPEAKTRLVSMQASSASVPPRAGVCRREPHPALANGRARKGGRL